MKATINADVEIWDIAVFAELAVWEPRPDLQLLCRIAREQGGLDDEAIGGVLPGLSARACQNLLRHLGYIQLVNGEGGLTKLGERCAYAGDAPSWEQGVYHLLVAKHRLFGCHILDYKRAPSDPFDSDYDLAPLPCWLSPPQTRVFSSALDHSRRFSIAGFPATPGHDPTCRLWELSPAMLDWEIDLSSGVNRWTIHGSVGDPESQTTFTSPAETADPHDLAGVYAQWEPNWDPRQGRVLMPYDGNVGAGGRELFLRSWLYENVTVGRYGTFDEVEVCDVPVGPGSSNDARVWAEAIQVARMEVADSYVSPNEWKTEWAAVLSGTPLDGRVGSASAPESILEVNGESIAARTRWLLTAGADIGMDT